MKILKKILIGLLAIVVLLLVVALFVPKNFTVSVSVNIHKPKQEVYEYMRILKKQEAYSEWIKADSMLHPAISGTDGSVGAKQSWNSKNDNVGEGSQTITSISPDRMDMDLEFIRPMAGKAKAANMFKEISAGETQVTSEFYSEGKWPFNLMGYFIGRPMIRKTQQKNLENIKGILEGK